MFWIISLGMQWANAQGRRIRLVEGDITKVPVDAIANAANSSLAGGGGVDGAIHRAGGPSIMHELDAIRAESGGCRTGGAVATGAGNLPARWVLHAVGPVYHDGTRGEPELLASAYRTCLDLANERGARTVSFPSISTGVYGYPMHEAARIAIDTVRAHLEAEGSIEEVVFVLFGKHAYDIFERALRALPQ
jgi:O-acetyl-ADP-ribose deacetylase (regulator of RNase III)